MVSLCGRLAKLNPRRGFGNSDSCTRCESRTKGAWSRRSVGPENEAFSCPCPLPCVQRTRMRSAAITIAHVHSYSRTRSTRKFRAGAVPTHQPSGSRASSAAAAAPLHGTSSVLSTATSPDRRRRIPEAH